MVPLLDCLNHSPAAQKLCKWCVASAARQVGALCDTVVRVQVLPIFCQWLCRIMVQECCDTRTQSISTCTLCRSQCGRLRYGCSHSNGERAGSSASTLRRGEELFLDYGVHYRLWDPAESHTPFQPCIADNLIPELQAFTRWGFVPEHD